MKRYFDYFLGVPISRVLSLVNRNPQPALTQPQKMLIIKLAAVGDTILLIPVLRALKKKYPELQVDWMVSKINLAIAQTVPYADNLIVLDSYHPRRLREIISRIKQEKYDWVIDFEQWARGTAILAYCSGAPVRVGFDTPGQMRASLFTHPKTKQYDRHEIDDFFSLLPDCLAIQKDTSLELWETPEGRTEAENILADVDYRNDGLNVLIHPGCGGDGTPREWPLPNYALIINWLKNKHHADIFLSAGPDEVQKSHALWQLVNRQAHDLGGKLSWPGMISLLSKMDLVISGNTGVMHLAAALKKPQVALHGPTNPLLWGPLNPNAVILRSSCPRCPSLKLGFEYHDSTQSCMKKISSEEVKKAISALIDKDGKI